MDIITMHLVFLKIYIGIIKKLGFTTLLLHGHIGPTQGYVPRSWAMDFIILEKVFMLIQSHDFIFSPSDVGVEKILENVALFCLKSRL